MSETLQVNDVVLAAVSSALHDVAGRADPMATAVTGLDAGPVGIGVLEDAFTRAHKTLGTSLAMLGTGMKALADNVTGVGTALGEADRGLAGPGGVGGAAHHFPGRAL